MLERLPDEDVEGKADPTYELTKSHLQGLIHFLDHVQDQAVEAGVPEKIVFPKRSCSLT
jgi:hypothetical protein